MRDIASYLEQTNLNPLVTDRDIDNLINETKIHSYRGVCIPPFWVKKVARELHDTATQVVTVVGFPLGYQMTETKITEIDKAISDGADELDLVMNLSAFKSKMPWVKIEIAKCASKVHEEGRILKVIIETVYLNDQEIEQACNLCKDAGADFVKTSTGFAGKGATVEHIRLMRAILPSHVGIKASGGIKTYKEALALIEAGADRIGTSSGLIITEESKANK